MVQLRGAVGTLVIGCVLGLFDESDTAVGDGNSFRSVGTPDVVPLRNQ